jgi:hypothetical protein
MKENWVKELTSAVREGRLVRALKISGQPPEPGSRFPEELSTELAAAAGAALNADTMPDRWGVLAEAVASSSVRRVVTPTAPPANVTDELKAAVAKIAGRVPAIAASLGIAAPASAPGQKTDARKPSGPPRQNVTQKKLAQKPTGPAPRPAAAPTGPRVMIGGRAIPPPPRPTAPVAPAAPVEEPAASEQSEDVGGTSGDDVTVAPVSAEVPAGNDVDDPGADSGVAVVAGVTDEDNVVAPEPENA